MVNESSTHSHGILHTHESDGQDVVLTNDLVKSRTGEPNKSTVKEDNITLVTTMNDRTDTEKRNYRKRGITIAICLVLLIGILVAMLFIGPHFFSFVVFIFILLVPVILIFDKQVTKLIFPLFKIDDKEVDKLADDKPDKYDNKSTHGKIRNTITRKTQDILGIVIVVFLLLVSSYMLIKKSSVINICVAGSVLSIAGAVNTYVLGVNFEEPSIREVPEANQDTHTHTTLLGPTSTPVE